MTEEQRAEIKKALIKCAEENEGKNTFTGYVIVSSVCKAGAERIAELEQKLEQTEKDLADYQFNYPTIKELQKENTELKKDNEGYEKDNARLVQQYNDLQKENAELKGLKDVATLISANNDTVVTLMQLNNMLVGKNQQLTKAKEIIKIAIEAYIKSGVYTLNSEPVYKEEVDRLYALFFDRAEQFLSEVEK